MSEIKVNKLSPRTGTTVTLGDSGDTITVPAGATFDSSSGTLTLPDGSVSLAKLSATGTKDATTFLRGDNTFASAGGDNTPSFFASKTDGNQTLSDEVATKITFNTELYDTDSAFASSTFTVPSGEAGKYFFSTGINTYDPQASIKRHIVYFYKNGSASSMANNDFASNDNAQMFNFHSVIFDLSVGDYIEVYSLNDTADGGDSVVTSSASKFETWFLGYKLIGV